MRVWLEPDDDPRRKLGFGWRRAETVGELVVIDTGSPNRVLGEALRAGSVAGLRGEVRAEVRYGTRSRVDFVVTDGAGRTFVEVKAVSLRRQGRWRSFPIASPRGRARHMADLAGMVAQGHRAVLIFLLQRTDCTGVAVARDIDPAYGRAFDAAVAAGVRVIALSSRIGTEGIEAGPPVPVVPGSAG